MTTIRIDLQTVPPPDKVDEVLASYNITEYKVGQFITKWRLTGKDDPKNVKIVIQVSDTPHTCSCPAYQFSHDQPATCKHIQAVQRLQATPTPTKDLSQEKPKIPTNPHPTLPTSDEW